MRSTKNIILLSVAVITFVIFFIEVSFSIYNQQSDAIQLKESLLENTVVKEAKGLDNQIGSVSQNARVLALLIENDTTYNTELYDEFIVETLMEQSMVFGMGYWFEPYKYEADMKHYGPYLYKNEDGQVVKTMEYSTADYDYHSWDWYNGSVISDKVTVYSAPFYDEYLDTVFMSGAVKVFDEEEQIGVVSIDITLREVNNYLVELNNIGVGHTFLITEEGFFWGNTDGDSRTLKENIKTSSNSELVALSTSLLESQEVGNKTLTDNIYVWAPIGDTGLKLVMGYPKSHLLSSVYNSIFLNLMYFIIAMTVFIILLNTILIRRIERPLVVIITKNMAYNDGVDASDFDQMIDLIHRLLDERQTYIADLNQSHEDLQEGYVVTVRSLSNAIEAKDKYTKGHCENVTKYSIETAKVLGLSGDDLQSLEYSALLHDVGKIGIPSSILNKPAKLTDEEFDVIKTHPAIGYDILKGIDFLERSAQVVYQHHERYDGKGYPRGIGGEDLDILTRIITVTDTYDAMTSARPYRLQPLSHEKAMAILQEGSGTQFDAKVLEAFVKVIEAE